MTGNPPTMPLPVAEMATLEVKTLQMENLLSSTTLGSFTRKWHMVVKKKCMLSVPWQ